MKIYRRFVRDLKDVTLINRKYQNFKRVPFVTHNSLPWTGSLGFTTNITRLVEQERYN